MYSQGRPDPTLPSRQVREISNNQTLGVACQALDTDARTAQTREVASVVDRFGVDLHLCDASAAAAAAAAADEAQALGILAALVRYETTCWVWMCAISLGFERCGQHWGSRLVLLVSLGFFLGFRERDWWIRAALNTQSSVSNELLCLIRDGNKTRA